MKGILKDVELLKQITEASRGAITAFVERTTNNMGQVVDVADKLSSILGFGINEPWIQYLSNTKFYRADREKLRTLFVFLGECLKLIVADNEKGKINLPHKSVHRLFFALMKCVVEDDGETK